MTIVLDLYLIENYVVPLEPTNIGTYDSFYELDETIVNVP